VSRVVLRLVEVRTDTHYPRFGGTVEVRLPRYEVLLDGEVIGEVEREMMTRETRTAGRRYVNSRWRSPGWTYRGANGRWSGLECYSRRGGVERLPRERGLRWPEDERLARAAEVRR